MISDDFSLSVDSARDSTPTEVAGVAYTESTEQLYQFADCNTQVAAATLSSSPCRTADELEVVVQGPDRQGQGQ